MGKILIFIIGFIFGVEGSYYVAKDNVKKAKSLDELRFKYNVRGNNNG